MKPIKQSEAVNHIKRLLQERRLDLPSRTAHQRWVVFEHQGRQIGIDQTSGVWIRELEGDWRCLAMPCNVSGAIQAIEFLTNKSR